jgi:ankyrin repeat protein
MTTAVRYRRLSVFFCGLLALPCAAAVNQSVAAVNQSLIDAIKDQNRNRIEVLIKDHADVNAAQPDGATPLAWAVYLDQPEVVDMLMRAGAKPNTVDQYGETPVTLASVTGDSAVLTKLIAAGADASAARWNGETALMLAARSGCLDEVKLLLDHGAKVNAVESVKEQNALMWAAAEGHSDVVDLLIKNGAEVKSTSKGGFTPLVFAVQSGSGQSVKSLLDAGAPADYALPNGTSVVSVAVSYGKPEVVKALLDHNAEVNSADKLGNSPLHLAAQEGDVEIVKLLLAKGANPNALTAKTAAGSARGANLFRKPSGEQTALLLAAKANHEDVMRALVAGGADPKIKSQDGTTILMAAAASGHLGVVKYAYELDPDLNAETTRKSTVMHAAVSGTLQLSTQAEICDVITFLASKGADVDPEDVNGRTPIVIANFFPIDKAVTLMTKLITDSGKTPKKSPAR